MSDLIGWSLDLGLAFIEWESSDRTAIEVAANRLAGNDQYRASFCPSIVGYYMVASDHTACLNGSAPLVSATPIDLSAIPVRARQPSLPAGTRSNFDFNVRAAQDPIWSAYYFTFRTEFPAVWSAVTDEINTGVRRGDSAEVVFEQSQRLMTAFIEAQGPYVSYAEAGAMIAVIDAELAFVEALSAHSVEACAEYVEAGNLSIGNMRALSVDHQVSFARASTALVSAMASGRRNPQSYEPLNREEWNDFWARVSSRGVSDSDISAIEAGEAISPARMCHFGVAYNQTIAALHPLDKVRVLSELFRLQ